MPLPSDPVTNPFWLQPLDVRLDVPAIDRRSALHAAAKAIVAGHALDPDHDLTRIFDALWRREQAGSTALGHGFAVPHARIPGIARPLTLYVRTHKPLAFGAPDGQPVSHLLVILVPVDGDHEDHLRLLAQVAALVSDRAFRLQVADAADADQAAASFRSGVERVLPSSE